MLTSVTRLEVGPYCARIFRQPSPTGYAAIQDFGASDRLVPLVAPGLFGLRLEDLDLA